MRHVYSTAGLSGEAKRAYWDRSLRAVCGEFDTCAGEWDEFFGHIDVRSVAGYDVVGHSMNPDRVMRSRPQIARSNDEFWFLILQISGRSRLQQKASEAVLMPGDMAIIDSGFPSVFIYDGPFRQCSLHLPRKTFDAKLGSRRAPYAERICGTHGMGALTGQFLRSLYADAKDLTHQQSGTVQQALLDMILTTIAPDDQAPAALGMPPARLAQLSHLQRFIEARLTDPDLTPSSVAMAYGISTRHLHRVFEAAGESVGDWMRRRRLERAKHDLLSAQYQGHSVIEIAFNWGFNDASHFSRSFKAAYGKSPRQYRIDHAKPHTMRSLHK